MQAAIGEIFSAYRKAENGFYSHSFTGTGMDFPGLLLITSISDDAAGCEMAEMLGSSGRKTDILRSHLHSAFHIGEDVLLKLSAPSSMKAEDLSDILSRHPELDGAVLSASLLSVNPSSDAIADAVSFVPQIRKIAVYTDLPEYGGPIYEKALSMLRDAGRPMIVSSDRGEIQEFLK